ncbi:MAG: hypothetical protein ACI4Q9_02010 [Candidatus Methanomethylophilaceae archaeon]
MHSSYGYGGGYACCRRLDMGPVSMKKVYCPCGCIVDLDKSYFERRLTLGKDPECVHCRNIRISREIDELNAHFDGIETDEDGLLSDSF